MKELFDSYRIENAILDPNLPIDNENCGYLVSSDGTSFPFIGNLFFPHLSNDSDSHFFANFFERAKKYPSFLQRKSQRPYLDIYAAFQPFNEAFKALYPFLDLAKKELEPEATILNLWDRNGWTTALLRSVFPTNRIVTIWEGNKDVLGYQGYYHWFSNEPEICILFCEVDQSIPLKDRSVDLVVGMDAFHRYDQVKLMNEMDRLCKADASFVFPHVHLSNSEPVPYFDRGCIQKHGLEYQSEFEQLSKRKGYVFSEPKLFIFQQDDNESIPIKSNPQTSDYNALIAILSDKWNCNSLSKLSFYSRDKACALRVLQNPLYKIDLGRRIAKIDYHNTEVKKLIERHPIFLDQVEENIVLSEVQSMILLLAIEGNTISVIAEKIGLSITEIFSLCQVLEKQGLIHVLPLSFKFFALQTFIGSQRLVENQNDLGEVWSHYSRIFSNEKYLIDSEGNELTYGETDEVIAQVKKKIQSIDGLTIGDKVAVLSSLNIENIILFWAATSCGLTVIPLSSSMADSSLEKILSTGVKLLFVDQEEYSHISNFYNGQIVLFDSEISSVNDVSYFSEWIYENANFDTNEVELGESDTAVILYTSGSTGHPKGIGLSHSNLISSGRSMNNHFKWKSRDIFMAMGGLEYMSGLRNATVCPLFSGTSILIPSKSQLTNVFALLDLVKTSKPTIIASNPAFYHLISKVDHSLDLTSLRLVLCTGNYLAQGIRDLLYDKHGIVIHNYYGLTETCGICIAQDPERSDIRENDIGIPVGSLVRVVDSSSDGVGLLQIWSDNLAKGIRSDKNKVVIDWFETGDLAFVDNEGRVHLAGRAKEVLKTKKEQLIPLSTIEELIHSIPEIDEVVAHTSKRNETEELILFIKGSTSDLMATRTKITNAINASITTEKIPLILYSVDHIPYVNGKINKDKLLDEAVQSSKTL